MNVVDSSAWLEYFAGTKNANHFADAIEDIENLIVPSVIIYEVFKKILREKGENAAINYTASMRQAKVVDLDSDMAVLASKIGQEAGLGMADSIIYATAWLNGATLWTQDANFEKIADVKYFRKQ